MSSNELWDDLEDDALQSAASGSRRKCGVASMLDVISADFGARAVESVQRTMANHRLTAPSIRKALESRVTPCDLPSVVTIQRHRTGACSCPREAS